MPESPRLQEKALKCTIIGLFKAFANTGEATGRKKSRPINPEEVYLFRGRC